MFVIQSINAQTFSHSLFNNFLIKLVSSIVEQTN